MKAFRPAHGIVVVCLSATILSGCHDAGSDPLAVILTDETRSVLAAEANLPSLPRLIDQVEGAEALAGAAEQWSDSWDLRPDEGRQVRTRLTLEAAEPLARAMGPAGVASAVRTVGETLAAAMSLRAGGIAETIAENLDAASVHHRNALTALAEGRNADALGAALQASDLIREVGPESVTRLLLARAESRLEALTQELPNGDDDGARVDGAQSDNGQTLGEVPAEEGPRVDIERGRRLIRGARLALEEGDYVRAIQRAYYACQVLGVDASS